jgi:hypothetical protein
VAERDGDDRGRRVRRGEGVGRERDERRGPALLVLEARELVAGDEGQRRQLGGGLVQLGQALAHVRAGVVGVLVAVPAAVPELAVVDAREDLPREQHLDRVEDDDDLGPVAVALQRLEQALGHPARQRVAQPVRQAGQRAVGDPRWVDGHDAVGAQQVLGLLAQDEGVQLAREQQQAERSKVIGHGGAA